MADGLYVGMAGAAARAEQLDSIADNLANTQSPGFKAARPAFESFLPPRLSPGKQNDKVFTAAVSTGVDLTPGPTVHTGNSLDLLPMGDDEFFAVQRASGEIAYTRNGKISLDGSGQLRAAGQLLLGADQLPIAVPPGIIPEVGQDGTVRGDGGELGRIGLFKVDGPMSRIGPSLLSPVNGTTPSAVDGRVRVGDLELGNFSALEATVQLVSAQRHYETSMQALQTYKRLDDRANEIGKVR